MFDALLQLGAVFVVSFLLPIVPLLPIRLWVLIPLVAANVSPLLVALTAGVGASLGTLPLYAVSATAKDWTRVRRWLRHAWVRRWLQWLEGKLFWSVFVFALVPLPDQLASVASGLKNYPASRLAWAFFLGRMPYFLLLAFLGQANRELIQGSWQQVLHLFRL